MTVMCWHSPIYLNRSDYINIQQSQLFIIYVHIHDVSAVSNYTILDFGSSLSSSSFREMPSRIADFDLKGRRKLVRRQMSNDDLYYRFNNPQELVLTPSGKVAGQ
jgi:hypothetical protein